MNTAATSLKPLRRAMALALAGLLLGGCAIGPDYKRPEQSVPAQFKHAEGWTLASPADLEHRGRWWELYGDATLNDLQLRLEQSNQTLAQSVAQYRQAQALARGARASFFPTVTGNVAKTRSGQGGGDSTVRLSDGSTVTSSGGGGVSKSYDASLGVNWEIDLWGKLRRQLESDTASMQASAADLAAARLSLQSELAQNYLQLRVLDAQKRLLEATIAGYQRALTLTQNQYKAGIVTRADVAQATTQLKSTEAQAIDLKYQRAQLENAIAVLVGVPPAEFSLAEVDSVPALPSVPALLPSQLLERRPDVAAAERRVFAANAQIGVARAAYFPSLVLGANVGLESTFFAPWLTAPSLFWSLGPQLAATIFDGGRRSAMLADARAQYEGAAADYRQTVLTSFQQVEDDLTALTALADEARSQRRASDAAALSLKLTNNRFQAGAVSYLDVVTAQTIALSNERTADQIDARRAIASVGLLVSLGGDWNASGKRAAE